MQIFISWSGPRSRFVAEALHGWLPKVLQSVKPWMSDRDIGAGARWLTEIVATLNSSSVGLICVTPENQDSPWLLFEAGALSKTLEQTCVCPIVFDMTPGQLKGPLTQFQANSLNRDGMARILSTINKVLGDRALDGQQLIEILEVWWPKLEESLSSIPPATEPVLTRPKEDQLEEILGLVREQLRRENIRLEASKERDERLDTMLAFLDQASTTMSMLQGQAQRLGAIGDGSPFDGQEVLQGLLSGTTHLDATALREMAALMKQSQESDKQRLQQLLSPPSESEAQ
jgi:hypothetical protein